MVPDENQNLDETALDQSQCRGKRALDESRSLDKTALDENLNQHKTADECHLRATYLRGAARRLVQARGRVLPSRRMLEE